MILAFKKLFSAFFVVAILTNTTSAFAFGLWTNSQATFSSPTEVAVTTYFLTKPDGQPSGFYYDENGVLQFSPEGFHHGIDIAGGGKVDKNRIVISDTEPTYAALDGKVVFTDFLPNGYGHQVIIYHGFNLNGNGQHTYTFYSHMGTVDGTSFITTSAEQIIPAGWQIGRQGNSGFTVGRTGIHLDFEIRLSPTLITDWTLTKNRRGDIQDLIAASPNFYLKKNLTFTDENRVKRIKPGPWPQIPSENIIDWPMAKHDLERTNSASQKLLPPLAKKWTTLASSQRLPKEVTVFGGKVYTLSKEGDILILDANTGQILNKFSVGQFILTYPAVTDKLLFVATIDAHVYALDSENGSVQWKFPIQKVSSVSPPVIFGGNIYVCGDKLYALNSITGKEVWSKQFNCNLAANPIVVGNGIIFASQSKESFDLEEQLFALNDQTGRVIWKKLFGSFRDLIFSKNSLYLNRIGRLISVDATVTETNWTFNCPAAADELNIDMFLTISNDKIYLVCDNFKLVGGFFRPLGKLLKLDANSGNIIWQVFLNNFLGEPVISNNTIYAPLLIPFATGKILALDDSNGSTLQEIDIGPFFREFFPGIFRFDLPTIAIGSNFLFSGDSNGNLHSFGK